MHLELQLEDRLIDTDVAPLEAAFIELFSEKSMLSMLHTLHTPNANVGYPAGIGLWTLDELIPRVGSVDRNSALKALATWVDMGVLKEDTENSFRLLEVAEEASLGTKSSALRSRKKFICGAFHYADRRLHPDVEPIADEPPPVSSVQQQQAEQMRVYWKVCLPTYH